MAIMEGTLWKWTNYLSGWQPRWFVLEVGVLAYYKSQEEVGLGSRGSVKMACCEISVHPTDTVRIDLKIPPDQYIYLRAATPAERQQWLVALGTAKACLTTMKHNGHSEAPGESENQLKEKMQELNMYRSLLLQQISTIKLLCTNKEDNQEFGEAATMLSATCDEFLKNICDCMDLAESNFGSSSSSPSSPTTSMNKTLSSTKHSAFRKQILHEGHRSSSPPPSPTSSVASTLSSTFNGPPSLTTVSDQLVHSKRTSSSAVKHPSTHTSNQLVGNRSSTNSSEHIDRRHVQASGVSANSALTHKAKYIESSRNSLDSQSSTSNSEEMKEEPLTFFTAAKFRFERIQLGADNGIPQSHFCHLVPVLSHFWTFSGQQHLLLLRWILAEYKSTKPIIMFLILFQKLEAKHVTDPKAFVTLQNIIYQELKSNTCTVKNSATDALLWLKRALEFMQVFLAEVVRGEKDLAVAAGTAYGKTLRRYHGWVVRGVFALAVKAVPYRSDFLTSLATTEKGVAAHKDVIRDMRMCLEGLSRFTNIINQLYRKHKLDSDDTV
ncbi:Pleckstrin y domain-containing A member 8 [Desmophyllum pertusum]|uniref:Pleckstrin homology domain-containing family A member 8 n=1 Tax=Desmophyllum pertusum TaxID=174260 RepID=A0A9X0D9Q2_9CNID|nr:Pleckstrin y domain-containing A member 8 [Desmophyllum pertusum]